MSSKNKKTVFVANPEEHILELREEELVALRGLGWHPETEIWFEARPQLGMGNWEQVEVSLLFSGPTSIPHEIVFDECVHASELTKNVTISVRDMIGRSQWSIAVGTTLTLSLKGPVDILFDGKFIEIHATFGVTTIGRSVPLEQLADFFILT